MRQKIFIKQTCRALLLYFICLTIAVAIDLIFFKVKNMYHTPALVAIFSGWVYLGLIQKTKQFGAVTCLGLAKKGNYENYENDKVNLLSYMVFSLGNLAPIVTMWLAPKAYSAQLLAKGKTQD